MVSRSLPGTILFCHTFHPVLNPEKGWIFTEGPYTRGCISGYTVLSIGSLRKRCMCKGTEFPHLKEAMTIMKQMLLAISGMTLLMAGMAYAQADAAAY